ncbi:MAG: SOS response-associated peptidase, partial [Phycisphaerae bacterium]|nr:SOS response-associated peptidase [Phycisphaerae bacterium]
MCGRFALTITGDAVAAAMHATPVLPAFVEALAAWQGRFNIAPTSVIPIVVGRSGQRPMAVREVTRAHEADGAGPGERAGESGVAHELLFARWGLIPFWAKEASIGAKLSNARSDTIAEKPAFREAWKSRRCLVPATAFYEWQVPADGSPKRPHAIASSSGELLALGG